MITISEIKPIIEHQRERATIIKMMNAQRSQMVSYITRAIGYNAFQDETEREAKWRLAEQIYKTIIDDTAAKEGFEEVTELVAPVCKAGHLSMAQLGQRRHEVEQAMIHQVKQLDITDWWVSVKGRSYLGLAIIIGEAGDIGNYENPAKLWKRFGLAVLDGVRQGGLPKGSCAAAWIEHGYCPRRRSTIWTIGDSLMKTNGKDGKYYGIYKQRKDYELARLKDNWIADGKDEKKFKPGHAHNRARRYMEKRLLRDLWNAWHGK